MARDGSIEPVITETIIPVVQQSLRRAASVDSLKPTEYFRVGANPTHAKHAEMMDTLAVNVGMRGQNLTHWVDALRTKMRAVGTVFLQLIVLMITLFRASRQLRRFVIESMW